MKPVKKQTVAFIQISQGGGERKYGVFDKAGNKLVTYTVADCGHGGFIAHQEAQKKYNISDAAWTLVLARQIRQYSKNVSLEF